MQWSLPVANKYLIQADTITCRIGKKKYKNMGKEKKVKIRKRTRIYVAKSGLLATSTMIKQAT